MSDATPDRYSVRSSKGGWWSVWDTRRDEVVSGGEGLTESAARDMARRLSDAYRRFAKGSPERSNGDPGKVAPRL